MIEDILKLTSTLTELSNATARPTDEISKSLSQLFKCYEQKEDSSKFEFDNITQIQLKDKNGNVVMDIPKGTVSNCDINYETTDAYGGEGDKLLYTFTPKININFNISTSHFDIYKDNDLDAPETNEFIEAPKEKSDLEFLDLNDENNIFLQK